MIQWLSGDTATAFANLFSIATAFFVAASWAWQKFIAQLGKIAPVIARKALRDARRNYLQTSADYRDPHKFIMILVSNLSLNLARILIAIFYAAIVYWFLGSDFAPEDKAFSEMIVTVSAGVLAGYLARALVSLFAVVWTGKRVVALPNSRRNLMDPYIRLRRLAANA